MKLMITKHFVVRALSLLVPLLICVLVLTTRSSFGMQTVCAALLCGCSVLLLSPLAHEEPAPSMWFAAGVSVLMCGATALEGESATGILVLLSVLAPLAYTVFRNTGKYRNIRTLFRLDSVWCSLEESSRLCFSLIHAGMCLALLVSPGGGTALKWHTNSLSLVALLFFILMYYRAYSGKTLLMNAGKEASVKEIIRGNMRGNPSAENPDEHMNAMYAKVLRLMEVKKPYLNETFCIEDLAAAVFSNKLYISKTINYFSGRNFCQFVNYYRVNYAVNIMKKDRSLKIMELSRMCGFHSVVTFNMAFKLFMNMSPSTYYGVLANAKA